MKNFPTFAKTIALAFAFFMAGHFAYASCNYTMGNYDPDCQTKFLSISSNNCTVSTSSYHTVTIQVNQSGGSFQLFPGENTRVVSSSISGTTITYVIALQRNQQHPDKIGLALHVVENGVIQSNFVAVEITP